jgi:hypothetical protein
LNKSFGTTHFDNPLSFYFSFPPKKKKKRKRKKKPPESFLPTLHTRVSKKKKRKKPEERKLHFWRIRRRGQRGGGGGGEGINLATKKEILTSSNLEYCTCLQLSFHVKEFCKWTTFLPKKNSQIMPPR